MNNYISAILFAVIFATFSSTSAAESLRCKTKLAQVGDTKAEVLDKCGDPIMADNFCQPVAVTTQPQGIQNGNNNVQNNIAIATCENVDIWTYHPGKGKFMTHLYFSRGQLQSIRYGDRVK
jgi:Protein of unknown function (DUF2845)